MAEVQSAQAVAVKVLGLCFWFRLVSALFSGTGMLLFIPVTMKQATAYPDLAPLMWTSFIANIVQELIFSIALVAMLYNLHLEIVNWIELNRNDPLQYPVQQLKPIMLVSFSDVIFDLSNILSAWLWVESSGTDKPIEAYVSFGFGWTATACDVAVVVLLLLLRFGFGEAFDLEAVTQQQAAAARDLDAGGVPAAGAAGAAGGAGGAGAYQLGRRVANNDFD